MTTAKECRELAAECRRWAAEAPTDKVQSVFLQMSDDWTATALRMEGELRTITEDEAKFSL